MYILHYTIHIHTHTYTILVWISTNMNYSLQFGGYYKNGRNIILQKKGFVTSIIFIIRRAP